MTRILVDADVRALLTPQRCFALQREIFQDKGSEAPAEGIRQGFEVPGTSMRVSVIAGVGKRIGTDAPGGTGLGVLAAGTKVITTTRANDAAGLLPRSMSVYILHEVPSGRPLAIVSSTYLTNLRTAATAVLAAVSLRVAGEQRVGLLGTGPIARCIVAVLASQASGWEVAAYSPDLERRTAFARDFAHRSEVVVDAAPTARDAAARPILIAATDGRSTVAEAEWLANTHTIVSVASRRTVAEIPRAALSGRRLAVDDRASAHADAAEFTGRESMADVHELAEVLRGEVALSDTGAGGGSGRGGDSERWFFKSTGLAFQDVVTVQAVYASAIADGVGVDVDFGG